MTAAGPGREFGPVVAAVVGAALFFGGILSLRGPRTPVPLPPPSPARLRFLPVASGSPAAESRELWSPLLFSLPSDVGFGRGGSDSARIRPPLEMPLPLPAFLPEPKTEIFDADARTQARTGARVPERFRSAVLPGIPVLPVASPPRWQVELPAGWQVADFALMPWPAEAAGERAWEVRAFVDFGETGAPRQVLVESSTRPEVNRTVARALRNWRLAEPADTRSGHLRMRYEPQGSDGEG